MELNKQEVIMIPIALCLGKEICNMAKKRFIETYSQGIVNIRQIIVDTETGVNYLLFSSSLN